jgi:hypothetical protein
MVRSSAIRRPSRSRSRSRPEIGLEVVDFAFSAGLLLVCCWLSKEFVADLAPPSVVSVRRDGGDAGQEEMVVT